MIARSDLKALLPEDKCDIDRAEAIVKLGYPDIEPVLPELLEWMQDLNWPVAHVLLPFLAKIDSPLIPHIRYILGTEDGEWKYSVLYHIVARSVQLKEAFRHDLDRLAQNPTPAEQTANLHLLARDILAGHGPRFPLEDDPM